MDDIFVGRLMSSPVETARPEAPIRDAAATMLASGIGSIVVVDDENRLEGILTTTDFVRIVADGPTADDTPVSAYMSTDLTTTTANEPVREIARTMTDQGIHHVPVVDDEEGVIGIVTTTDLTAYLSSVDA
jgi:CBS domain-containing protein